MSLIKRLEVMVERDLQMFSWFSSRSPEFQRFSYGNLSEIEFEFDNEVEFSIHLRSPSSEVEYACLET